MNDTKQFYTDRLSATGFVAVADVAEGRESVTKMTPAYHRATMDMAMSVTRGWARGEVATLLDVGCGTGELLPYLRELGWEGDYVGVDIVPGLVDGCNQFHSHDPKAKFLCGDITDRKFRKTLGQFHTVASLAVFGLVDRASFIREVVEACFDLSTSQYVFTCNSKVGYGRPSNKGTMRYDPKETMDTCMGFTTNVTMRHQVFESHQPFALMAWNLSK